MVASLKITNVDTLPLTLQVVKNHLRVLHDDHDVLINDLIAAGCEEFDQTTGRAFASQTCEFRADCFPDGTDPLWLPRPPVVSVESVEYYDSAGTLTELDVADYLVDTHTSPARIVPTESWPISADRPGAVIVSYTAGNPASAPKRITNALLLWVDLHYHANHLEPTAARIQRRIEAVLREKSLRHDGLRCVTVTD